jgi:EAL domain-containing protein (putative c-di-GMP-specific phosphodiesterase class I)
LWYQPKFDLKSLRVCGAEALLRAQHPEHGLLLPAHVLPEPGDVLHQALAGFVLRRAMSDWNTFASSNVWTKIAVNMPLSVIVAPQFVRAVRDTLPRQAEFPGLIVEVTEDEVIHDPELIHEVATQLQVYGVSISVDDFGEGYSSLGRLNSLPFVELKIDRSFVFNCAEDPLKQTICQTIVDLGHRLNATVCAEGVETLADLKAVVKLGCDTAQGFLFSKPMPAAEFLDLASVYGRLQNRDSEALKS